MGVPYAQSVFKRSFELECLPVLKKPHAQWNNQNWRMEGELLIIPVCRDGKTQQERLRCAAVPLEGKAGILRIKKKRGKWIADLTLTVEDAAASEGYAIMGVDLGIKVPAVAHIGGKGTRFFGNGRSQRHMRRCFYARRKKLQQAKKMRAVRKSKDKESRWMKNINHQLSRQIVNHAHAHCFCRFLMSRFGVKPKFAAISKFGKLKVNAGKALPIFALAMVFCFCTFPMLYCHCDRI